MDIILDECFPEIQHYARMNAIEWVKKDLMRLPFSSFEIGQYIEVKVIAWPGLYTLRVSQVDHEVELVTLEPFSYVR